MITLCLCLILMSITDLFTLLTNDFLQYLKALIKHKNASKLSRSLSMIRYDQAKIRFFIKTSFSCMILA